MYVILFSEFCQMWQGDLRYGQVLQKISTFLCFVFRKISLIFKIKSKENFFFANFSIIQISIELKKSNINLVRSCHILGNSKFQCSELYKDYINFGGKKYFYVLFIPPYKKFKLCLCSAKLEYQCHVKCFQFITVQINSHKIYFSFSLFPTKQYNKISKLA